MNAIRLLSESAEGPNTELLWLIYIGIGFFFLVILLGWWAGSGKQSKPEAGHGAGELEKRGPDDLVRIEGIGPKVAKILNQAGIESFAQLAEAQVADIQPVLDKAGLQMMNPEGWIEQAKFAAMGDWKNFEKLQQELKGGRKKN